MEVAYEPITFYYFYQIEIKERHAIIYRNVVIRWIDFLWNISASLIIVMSVGLT